MRLSLIIPTHNRPTSLARTLRSALDLDYPHDRFEILVVDDSSTDETADVVHDLQSARGDVIVRYVRAEHVELSEGRHIGAQAASGELLLFVDDDVTFAPKWASAYAAAFAEHDEMAAAGGPARAAWASAPPQWLIELIDRKYPYTGGAEAFGPLSLMDRSDELLIEPRGYFFGLNMAIRRDVLFDVGGFNPDTFGRKVLGDGETGLVSKLWARGLLVGYVPDALVHHHIDPKHAGTAYLRHRMWKQGACNAYTEFHPHVPGRRTLARHAVTTAVRATRWSVKAVRSWNQTDPESLVAQMEAAQEAQHLAFTVRLMFDAKRRAFVERTDWLETSANGPRSDPPRFASAARVSSAPPAR